jgi:hypothetical protein
LRIFACSFCSSVRILGLGAPLVGGISKIISTASTTSPVLESASFAFSSEQKASSITLSTSLSLIFY